MTNDEQFYQHLAGILQCEYDGKPFAFHKRTRWNNRTAGQGRYLGFGIVRVFGDRVHVALTHPIVVCKVFDSKDDVIALFKTLSTQ